jgi:predicted exporter
VSRKLAILGLWLALMAAAAVIVAHARITTDMSAFLPRSPTAQQRVLVDLVREGPMSRILMVEIENVTPAAAKDIAARLRGDPAVEYVQDGDQSGTNEYGKYLWQNRYLLNPDITSDRFTASALRKALESDLAELGSTGGIALKQSLPADPTGELMGLIDRIMPARHPALRDGVWFSADGTNALMLVGTKAAAFDIDAQQKVVTAIQDAAAASSATARVIGPGVFAIHGRDTMKADTTRFSTLASMLVAALLLLAYRRPAMLVLAFLPVASGVIAGIAAVALAYGTVHGITLGFGVTLIGEAVDYAIYYFTYAGQHRDLSRLWPTLILGMSISVAGFAAMLFSSFAGFAQLGMFTVAGLVTALAVTRFVLPVFPVRDVGRAAAIAGRPLEWLSRPTGWQKPVVVLCVLAGLSALAMHRGAIWESSLASLSPADPADMALNDRLRQEFGLPDTKYLAVVTAPGQQQALQQADALVPLLDGLVSDGTLTGYRSPTVLLPAIATQQARQTALPAAETLKANLDEATTGLPFKPGLFDPFLADVERARTAAALEQTDIDTSPMGMKLKSMVNHSEDGWTVIVPLDVAAAVPEWPAALAPHIVDLPAMSATLLAGYRHEATELAICGSAAIVVLLGVALRSARRVVLVIAPLAASVAVTAGLLVTIQHQLGLFNLFGLLLTVAVGSNYCLFFERRSEGSEDRPFAALALANLCTVIGFGVLAFSGIPVLRGIGGTVAIGAALSLVFGAILIQPRKAIA